MKCGHQKKRKFKGDAGNITFYVAAKDMGVAIDKCKKMPTVRHNDPTALVAVKEITEGVYKERRANYNAYDNAFGNIEKIEVIDDEGTL